MEIKQFRYLSDNLGYLIYSGSRGVAVDGGAVDQILLFCNENGIEIKIVTNTHSHHDHVTGNRDLLKKTKARFVDCRQIDSDQTLEVGDEHLEVFPTPGHTSDSICFAGPGFLVTGDTLFNGTVGNCFSGDLKAFYRSLKRLTAYPESTKIYAGHDYVQDSMKYAKIIEPDNPYIDRFSAQYSRDPVVSALADELKVNPYIRFDAPEMIENLKKRGQYNSDEFERFKVIMELY